MCAAKSTTPKSSNPTPPSGGGYPVLDIEIEEALFSGRVQGVVTPFYENERPLHGVAGKLDWRFESVASQSLRSGMIFGKPGECIYFPVERAGKVYHWFLIGGGYLNPQGRRGLLPDESFAELKKNLPRVGLKSIGISRRDFGGLHDEYLRNALGEVPLWIAP